jgi:hypothetical protein
MFKLSKKKSKSGLCSFCETLSVVMTALATICTLAALAGLYKAHVLSGGLTFGTSTGSLSIVALVFSLYLLKKTCDSTMCDCKVPKK